MWTDEKAIAIALTDWLRRMHAYDANALEEGLFGLLGYRPARAQVRAAIEWLDRLAHDGTLTPAAPMPAPPAGGWD